jgi:hypothetical protein
MREFPESYVSRVLFAMPHPVCARGTIAAQWHQLRTKVFDPYRPELHYMRGPGPKWREKQSRTRNS